MQLFTRKPSLEEAQTKSARVEQEIEKLLAAQEERRRRQAEISRERGELLALQAIGEAVDTKHLGKMAAEMRDLEQAQRDAEAVLAGLHKAWDEVAAAVHRAEAEHLYRELEQAVLAHLEAYKTWWAAKEQADKLAGAADEAKEVWKRIYPKFRQVAGNMVPAVLPSGAFNVPESAEDLEKDLARVKEALGQGYCPKDA